jgi:hypothetical protein
VCVCVHKVHLHIHVSVATQQRRHTDTDLCKPHRPEHLRTEHAGVADLDPLVQTLVPVEDLHGRLRVRIVRGLEADVVHAQLGEESLRTQMLLPGGENDNPTRCLNHFACQSRATGKAKVKAEA